MCVGGGVFSEREGQGPQGYRRGAVMKNSFTWRREQGGDEVRSGGGGPLLQAKC